MSKQANPSSGSSAPKNGSGSSKKSSKPKSDYAYIRDNGWENERHFMHSFGLKEPDGFEEARKILDAMREADGAGVSPFRGDGVSLFRSDSETEESSKSEAQGHARIGTGSQLGRVSGWTKEEPQFYQMVDE